MASQSADYDLVLLLHCSASSSRQWSRLIAQAPDLPLRAIDLHGYGAMPMPVVQPGVPYSLDREVELVEAAMAGADRVALIGHSYGGAVALLAAIRFRERVFAVVAHEPTMFFLLEKCGEHGLYAASEARRRQIEALVDAGEFAAGAKLLLDEWGVPGNFSSLKADRQAGLASRASKIVLDMQALLFNDSDLQTFAGLPALITYGEKSREAAIRVAQLLGGLFGGPVVIPGAGHMAPVTHPEEFNRIALDFVRTGSAARPA